jgi:hypothetical protein
MEWAATATSQDHDLPEGVRRLFAQHPEYRYVNMPMYHADALDANGALKPEAKPFALKRYVSPDPEGTMGPQLSAQLTPSNLRNPEAQLNRWHG